MTNALEVEGLCVGYNKTLVLKDLSLCLESGEFLAIIGPNGGGKTTFLKAALGLTFVSSGKTLILGQSVNKIKNQIGYVAQSTQLLRSFPITVHQTVMTAFNTGGVSPFFRYKSEHKDRAFEILKEVNLDELCKKQPSELSGGEFQRLLIARAIACQPKILFLDEPTASVDPKSRQQIYSLIKKLNDSMTVVMVTHDLSSLSNGVTKLAFINRELKYYGTPEIDKERLFALYSNEEV